MLEQELIKIEKKIIYKKVRDYEVVWSKLTILQQKKIEQYLRNSPYLDDRFYFGESTGGEYLEEFIQARKLEKLLKEKK